MICSHSGSKIDKAKGTFRHNILRTISTAAESNGFLALLHGCEESLCVLLQNTKFPYAIQDGTRPG